MHSVSMLCVRVCVYLHVQKCNVLMLKWYFLMVNMLSSTFALDLQTFLITICSVHILCFCTSLVEVKWIAGCSIERTPLDLYLEHQLITLCTVPITAAAPPPPTAGPAQTETTSQPSLSLWEAARKWAM